jgi:hypothetical protein
VTWSDVLGSKAIVVGVNGANRYPESLGSFVDRQTSKETHFHDLGLARILSGEHLKRHVDSEQVGAWFASRNVNSIERHSNYIRASSSLSASSSRDVYENTSHHLGRKRRL